MRSTSYYDAIIGVNSDGELELLKVYDEEVCPTVKTGMSFLDELKESIRGIDITSEEEEPEVSVINDLLGGDRDFGLATQYISKGLSQGLYEVTLSIIHSSSFDGEFTEYDMEFDLDNFLKIA